MLLHYEESEASMKQAIALWEPLSSEFPDKPTYLENLARANFALGKAWQRDHPTRVGTLSPHAAEELLAQLKEKFPTHELSAGFQFGHGKNAARRDTGPAPRRRDLAATRKRNVASNWLLPKPKRANYPGAPKYQNAKSRNGCRD